jgi:hypothetical protein
VRKNFLVQLAQKFADFYGSRNFITVIKIAILLVVFYGCETWSLTLREKRRLRMFENRVLRRVFGPKREEVTGNGESCITRS